MGLAAFCRLDVWPVMGRALFVIVVVQGFRTAADLLEDFVGNQANHATQDCKYKHVKHTTETPFSIPLHVKTTL